MRIVDEAVARGVSRRDAMAVLDIEMWSAEPRNPRGAGRLPMREDHPNIQKRIERLERELKAVLQKDSRRGVMTRIRERAETLGILSGRYVGDWVAIEHSENWS